MKNILLVIVVVVLAIFAYKYFQTSSVSADAPAITTTASKSTATDSSEAVDGTDNKDDINSIDGILPTYNESVTESSTDLLTESPAIAATATVNPISYSCDGRQHCSQMSSCAEATYFSKNCPNTKMDGNNDGVPCEQQWCN